MGLYRALDCIKYEGDRPILKVSIFNSGLGWKKFELPLDTGYSGGILLPSKVYHEIIEFEYPRSLFPIYNTLIGEVIMRRGIAIVKIFDIEFESIIETPLYGGGRYLAGRSLIKKLDIALLGRDQKLCNLQRANSSNPI